jgi:hypothetical protein
VRAYSATPHVQVEANRALKRDFAKAKLLAAKINKMQ